MFNEHYWRCEYGKYEGEMKKKKIKTKQKQREKKYNLSKKNNNNKTYFRFQRDNLARCSFVCDAIHYSDYCVIIKTFNPIIASLVHWSSDKYQLAKQSCKLLILFG